MFTFEPGRWSNQRCHGNLKRVWGPESNYQRRLGSEEFRLLRIVPGNSDDPLECHLETHSFPTNEGQTGDVPHYRAVSYRWSGAPKTISLDGKSMTIGESLWELLWRIRNASREPGDVGSASSRLWVDSLCINQGDEVEKGFQVSLMGDIYSRAASTIVWLGVPVLEQQLQVRSIIGDVLLADRMRSNGAMPGSFDPDEVISSLFLDTAHDLAKLISGCDYWGRAWIVQEFVLSVDLQIWWGDSRLSWAAADALLKLAQEIANRPSSHELPYARTGQTIKKLTNLRNNRQQLSCRTAIPNQAAHWLKTLLEEFRHAGCHLAMDRVFAFVGLVNIPPIGQQSETIEANYRDGIYPVYLATLAYLAQHALWEECEFLYFSTILAKSLTVVSQLPFLFWLFRKPTVETKVYNLDYNVRWGKKRKVQFHAMRPVADLFNGRAVLFNWVTEGSYSKNSAYENMAVHVAMELARYWLEMRGLLSREVIVSSGRSISEASAEKERVSVEHGQYRISMSTHVTKKPYPFSHPWGEFEKSGRFGFPSPPMHSNICLASGNPLPGDLVCLMPVLDVGVLFRASKSTRRFVKATWQRLPASEREKKIRDWKQSEDVDRLFGVHLDTVSETCSYVAITDPEFVRCIEVDLPQRWDERKRLPHTSPFLD